MNPDSPTSSSGTSFRRLYREGLEEHLDNDCECTLEKAQLLGRQFLSSGGGIVELSLIHHELVDAIRFTGSNPSDDPGFASRASVFLTEALTPFEVALRGYQEENERLRDLNDTLEDRVEKRSRKLVENQREYERLIERLHGIFYSVRYDPEPELTFVSPQIENILGYAPGEFTLQTWLEALHPDDRASALATWRDAFQRRDSYALEYRIYTRNGELCWIRDEGTYLEASDDATPQVYGIALEITERRNLEQQFVEAQKMDIVGRMAGSVAHDFKNLLAVILSFAQILERAIPEEEPHHGDAQEIIRAARHADDLVRQLLGFARGGSPERSRRDLTETVHSFRPMVERLIPDEQNLSFELVSRPLPIVLDPRHLEQALLNLVLNARKATTSDEDVVVGTDLLEAGDLGESTFIDGSHEQFTRLYVRDTGTGIDPEHMERIFEPFFTTDPDGRGTGLGLPTTRRLIRINGGDILVDSIPGEGSCFSIVFPLSDSSD